jgi:hypothetical protein
MQKKDILYENAPWITFMYVQYALKIIKQKIFHPYLDCRQYSREGKLLGLNLHLRSLGSLETLIQMHTRNHPHNLPAIIHPSLNNKNTHGTGQAGLHKMSLLNLGTRDGEIQTLGITNSNMQYQFLRIHACSTLQTYSSYYLVLIHLHYSSYCLVLLHLHYHPFHKILSSLRIHHVLPFCPFNPFRIQPTDHPYHSIMLISRTIQLTT